MARYKVAADLNKSEGNPHPDWQLNNSFYKRFSWPEHDLSWHDSIPTHATFSYKAIKQYYGRDVEITMTTILNFHQPQEQFKKEAVSIAKAYGLGIQEAKKHVLFGQD